MNSSFITSKPRNSKMHLRIPMAYAAVRSKLKTVVVDSLLIFLLLGGGGGGSVFVPCFIVQYFMSVLVLQSS